MFDFGTVELVGSSIRRHRAVQIYSLLVRYLVECLGPRSRRAHDDYEHATVLVIGYEALWIGYRNQLSGIYDSALLNDEFVRSGYVVIGSKSLGRKVAAAGDQNQYSDFCA